MTFDSPGCGCGRCQHEFSGKREPRTGCPQHAIFDAGCDLCVIERAIARRNRRIEARMRRSKNRRNVSYAKRMRVYERDGHKCRYCGTPERLTIDHIIPIVAGGSNQESNLQTLCEPCNWEKGGCTKDVAERERASA